MVAGGLGSVLTGVGIAALTLLSWVTLNFFGNPILTLKEKRREALEVAERYAYMGLTNHDTLLSLINDDGILSSMSSDEYQSRAITALRDAGNWLRSYARERSLATQLYCLILYYDLIFAASAMFCLAEAAHSKYPDKKARRLILHTLFVSLGATHHL